MSTTQTQTITPKAKFPSSEDQQAYQQGLTRMMEQGLPSQFGTSSPEQVTWERGLKLHELFAPMSEEQINGIVADHLAVRRATKGGAR